MLRVGVPGVWPAGIANVQLFLVLTIWGQVGVTAGPLPYDMSRCLEVASQREQAIDETFRDRSVITEKGRLVWRSDLSVGCGMFEAAPPLRSTLAPDALTYPGQN